MKSYPSYAIYGHHKCATMSLNTIAAAICRRLGLRFQAVFNESQFGENLATFTAKNKIDFLSFGNADYEYVKSLPDHRAVHIIRDPRDIVVSAYFSHLYSHSTKKWTDLLPHREKLKSMSTEEGLMEEIRFRERSFRQMGAWDYDQDNVLEIRFEDFAKASYETLLKSFEHLGLVDDSDYRFGRRIGGIAREIAATIDLKFGTNLFARSLSKQLPASELLIIAWRNRFQAKAQGRKQGDEDVGRHYRKGASGDWVQNLSASHITEFKRLYPGLVRKLGYADGDDW